MPVFAPSQPPIANVFNFSPQNLKNWRKALANVRAGVKNSRVLYLGDSTAVGINASGTLTWPNITTALGSQLIGGGVPATSDSFCGFSVAAATTGSRLGTDPRLTAGSWNSTTNGGIFTAGGAVLQCSSGTTPFQFVPAAQTDTANIFWVGYGTGGKATLQLGAGTSVQINESSGTNGMNTTTLSATLGSNTLSFVYNSGSTVYIPGVEVYNSAVKSVNIMNCGWWGSNSTNWNSTTNAYGPINIVKYLAPDLSIICLGINDWIAGSSVATMITNLQALISAAQMSGDVIILTPTPNTTNLSAQPSYVNAMYQLAAANNCVLIDNYARFVSEVNATAFGFMSDSIHPSALGYADQAQTLKNVLLNV